MLDYQLDVALLDIGLSGWEGYEVARRMCQEPSLRHVVLVAVTGYGTESDRDRAREAGPNHHLIKLLDFEKLQRLLVIVASRL